MASKRYTISLTGGFFLVLVLFIFITICLIVLQWYLTSAALFLLALFVILTLYRKIDKTNRTVSKYFTQLLSGDLTSHFSEDKYNLGFNKLHKTLNKVTRKINQLEQSNRKRESLFEYLIENLNVGIFLLDESQALKLLNPKAKQFLNIRSKIDSTKLKLRAPHFYSKLEELRCNRKVLIEIENQGEIQKWSIHRAAFMQEEKEFELFIVNNVQAELERKESEVSEKLIHTLTHEIMNSISPITSLIDTLKLQLMDPKCMGDDIFISRENYDDLATTVQVIQNRGKGLIEFVERYALLARLPHLKIDNINGENLINELINLMSNELSRLNIQLKFNRVSRQISFRADKQLLIQVLINLIKNSTEAYNGKNGTITISLLKRDGYNLISIFDNAGGVPIKIRKDIFMPFFSTKEKGSGIGLSLSRKIIQSHNGRLYLKSHEKGAEFCVELAD